MTLVTRTVVRRAVDPGDLRILLTAAHALGVHLRSARCEAIVVDRSFGAEVEEVLGRLTCSSCRGRTIRRDDTGELFEACRDCDGTGVAR